MTKMPKAAWLAALMIGTAVAPTAPALAKKKEAAPTGPQFAVNAKVREAQAAALVELGKVRALTGPSGVVTPANQAQVIAAIEAAEPHIAAAEAAAQTNDEQYVTAELRYRKTNALIAARSPNNAAGQAAGNPLIVPVLDRLLANPVTPQESIGKYAFDRARIAYLAQEYRPALALLRRAQAAGAIDTLLDPMIVDTMVKLNDYAGAAAEAEKMIARMKAAGQQVPEPFYAIGIENAYRSKNPTVAIQYEQKRLADYPGTKNLHDALIRMLTRSQLKFDTRQKLDVWRLMRASKSLADQKERELYAADALEVGASREAQAVLEEFRAGRPIASLDPSLRTLLTQANARASAAVAPAKAEADARAASDAQSALTAANFNYAAGNYGNAVGLYQLALQRGAPDRDAVLISLGAAQAQSNDRAGAQASFAAVQSSPRKEIAAFWLYWLTQP